MRKKRVLVGMSGGVDSSVSAALLKQQGYDVIGFFFSIWKDPTYGNVDDLDKFPQNKCCSIESMEDARRVCAFLDIPFYVFNVQDHFKETVVDYFLDEYGKGLTPNPCAKCNRDIKFGYMIEKMEELGADFIATGHYAQIKKNGESYELWESSNKDKDQSYFLYALDQYKLSHILFPVGMMPKSDVRTLAQEFKLPLPVKKESQGLSFVPDKKVSDFLLRNLSLEKRSPGPIRTTSGEILPLEHKGLPLYTIGQRKGLDIGGLKEPLYVVDLDVDTNTLVVGEKSEITNNQVQLKDVTWISGTPPTSEHLSVRVRYHTTPVPCSVELNGTAVAVAFDHPVWAVTPGQVAVMYEGEKILGGGIIERVPKNIETGLVQIT